MTKQRKYIQTQLREERDVCLSVVSYRWLSSAMRMLGCLSNTVLSCRLSHTAFQPVSRRYSTLQCVPICSVIPIQCCHVCRTTPLTQQVVVVLPAVSYHYFSNAVLFCCPASSKVCCCPVCSNVMSCQQCSVVLCVVLYCQVKSAVLPAHSTASLAQGFQYCTVCDTILDKQFNVFLSAVTSFPLKAPDKSTFHHTAHCTKAKTRLYT